MKIEKYYIFWDRHCYENRDILYFLGPTLLGFVTS